MLEVFWEGWFRRPPTHDPAYDLKVKYSHTVELNTDIQNMEPLATVNPAGISCSRFKKWPRFRSIFLKGSRTRGWGPQNVSSNRNSYFPAKNTPYAKNKSSWNLGTLTFTLNLKRKYKGFAVSLVCRISHVWKFWFVWTKLPLLFRE